jgi:hypothetical protein
MRPTEILTSGTIDVGCTELSIPNAGGLKVVDDGFLGIPLGECHDWR